MAIRLSSPEYMALIAALNAAMVNRDKRAAERVQIKIEKLLHPERPIDIAKIRALNRIYASDLFDWDMD